MLLNLAEDNVGVVLFGYTSNISDGYIVKTTGRVVEVPVGDALTGRVVNALGQPIDGKGPVETDKFRRIERVAHGVIERKSVDTRIWHRCSTLLLIPAVLSVRNGWRTARTYW